MFHAQETHSSSLTVFRSPSLVLHAPSDVLQFIMIKSFTKEYKGRVINKRDAHSLRLKLAIGCLPEKIITALHSVNEEHPNQEAALNKCNAAVCKVGKVVEDVENTLSQVDGSVSRPPATSEAGADKTTSSLDAKA